MRCNQASYQLQLYIDHRLPFEQTRSLEIHVASCLGCRAELELLEEATFSLAQLKRIEEPPDLTVRIMQRIALSSERKLPQYSLLRPSLTELLVVIALATVATLGSILQVASLRALLPLPRGNNLFSESFLHFSQMLITLDSSTLILALWVVGTLVGVCITLALVGSEIRAEWYKAMVEHLPVR